MRAISLTLDSLSWTATRRVVGIAIFAATAFVAPIATGATSSEFAQPDWSALPRPSRYNTAPSVTPTRLEAVGQSDYAFPRSKWPPSRSGKPRAISQQRLLAGGGDVPDLEVYAIEDDGGYTRDDCTVHLPHYRLLVDAKAAGYPISHKPAVGDVYEAPYRCMSWVVIFPPSAVVDSSRSAAPSYSLTDDPVPGDCANRGGGGWYDGYVTKVLPDGSWIAFGGGSDTPSDSGLVADWFSPVMDVHTEFIGLRRRGTHPRDVGGPSRRLRTASLPGVILADRGHHRQAVHLRRAT